MMYNLFGYHEAPVEPVRDTTEKIFGLELEISSDAQHVIDELNCLIEDNVLTVPYNEDETCGYICAEADCSVFAELILRADYKEELVRRVRNYLGGLRDVGNHEGTSAHVHISRDYLDTRGLSAVDIVKAAEFLYPLLYSISGRDLEGAEEWASSYIGHEETSICDFTERGAAVDEIYRTSSSRYMLVNDRNRETVELRIFSNYYDFNPEYIEAYLESADIIIDIAEYMQGQKYEQKAAEVLRIYSSFLEERAPRIWARHIKNSILTADEIRTRRAIDRFERAGRRLNVIAADVPFLTTLRNCRELLYFIEDYPEFKGVSIGTNERGLQATIAELRRENINTVRRTILGY